jgi:TetR/AcrR family transcriptional regulator, tetracycline repressor protein
MPANDPIAAKRGARRRGRPPRLTKDQILAAGLSLVRKQGAVGLTARALAERIGASPMALYGHFESKQALLSEIASHAVEQMTLRVPRQGDWRTILGAWLRSLRKEFRTHPELLPLLAEAGICSRYLLASFARVVAALGETGLSRAAAVRAVEGSMWAVIGFVVCETAEHVKVPRVMELLDEHDRERVGAIVPHLALGETDALFDGVLARTLDGLEAEIGRARTKAKGRVPARRAATRGAKPARKRAT